MTLRRGLRCATLTAFSVSIPVFAATQVTADSSPSIEPRASEIVRQYSEGLKSARSISVKAVSSILMASGGQKHQLDSRFDIAVERPNKLAIIHKEGLRGSTIVSDGKILTLSESSLDEVTTTPAPATIQEIALNFEVRTVIDSSMILCSPGLFGSMPYDNLMDGVTTGTYGGTEQWNDQSCHRLHFEQKQFHWDAWFTDTHPPLMVKAEILPADEIKKHGKPAVTDVTTTLSVEFRDWQFDVDIPDSTFDWTLQARNSATAAHGTSGKKATPSIHIASHLGRPAPQFNMPLLDGGNIDNATLAGKVIVFDFWATWCGPCRRGMPLVEQIAKQFHDQPVEFYAVNLREGEEEIEKFLIKEKLALKVALDKDGGVGKTYGIRAIPTTLVIGKDGTIQAFHEGVGPRFKDTLTSQIETLLSDEKLVAQPKEKPQSSAAAEQTTETSDAHPLMKTLWRLNGRWNGLAYDEERKVIVASGHRGKCADIDINGNIVREFTIEGLGGSVRLAQLDKTAEREIVTFIHWRSDVFADTINGEALWNFPQKIGVNDAAAGDLDGDGKDEVVIGFNGHTGLYAVAPDGQLLWKNEELGNHWHCCIGDIEGDGQLEVLSTSALGDVHIFNSTGERERDIDPGFYANMVRVSSAKGKPVRILAAGSKTAMEVMAAFSSDGNRLWETLIAPEKSHVDSMAVSPCGGYVAVGVRDSDVIVADTGTGKIIGKAKANGSMPEIAWASTGAEKSPVLVVATGEALSAFGL